MEWLNSFWMRGLMPVQFLALLVLLFLTFDGGNYFLKKVGWGVPPFWQAILIWLTFFVTIKYVIRPPIPVSLVYMYMVVVTVVIFVLISASDASWHAFLQPVLDTVVGATQIHVVIRTGLFALFPLLAGFGTYNHIMSKYVYEEPYEARQWHVAPPHWIEVHGEQVELASARNPFRVDATGDYLPIGQEQPLFNENLFESQATGYLQYVKEGGDIYFRNCVFCHGAHLDGRGLFTYGFRPLSPNLVDPGTIAQLQESYVFWRISKGVFDQPFYNNPWDSSMPAGEDELSTDDMWKVTLFIYWYTKHIPRTWD